MPKSKIVRRVLADGTVKEYRYERKTVKRKRPPRRQPPAVDSVASVLKAYEDSRAYRRLAANTKALYARAIREIEHKFGPYPISGVERRHVRKFLEPFDRSPSFHNTLLSVLRNVVAFAMDDGLLTADPTARLERLPVGRHRRWSDAQVAFALRTFPEHLRRAVALAYGTGQREGDLCAMRWDQYDGQTITLRQGKTMDEHEEPLVIPVPAWLRAELDAWKEERRTLTILANAKGRPWRVRSFASRISERIAMHPELDGLCFHGLRHAVASRLAEHGATAPEIAAVTGHKSLASVQVYLSGAQQKVLAFSAVRKTERGA